MSLSAAIVTDVSTPSTRNILNLIDSPAHIGLSEFYAHFVLFDVYAKRQILTSRGTHNHV